MKVSRVAEVGNDLVPLAIFEKNASLAEPFPLNRVQTLATISSVPTSGMLPPQAQKKLQYWIRSRHLICSGNFYIFETVDYTAVERFTGCITALGGTLISVDPVDKIWMGNHRQVMLYRARASLHTPCHNLKQYWIKHGSFHTRFDERSCELD